ncbi:mitochondrial carrier domain-containing protein [Morchella snyderi]|nr:mitochondrial carrier domain-containing protein [Morchella snyderi]
MASTDILLAGAIAAFTVDLLIYPLDTLKTRLQKASPATRAARRAFWRTPQLYRGLYQGVGSVVVATAPAAGVFFTTYEFLLAHTHSAVLASSLAEACSCAIITPAEVIKQNAQVIVAPTAAATTAAAAIKQHGGGGGVLSSSSSSSSLQALRRISRVSHLWRGYTTLVGRNLPFTAMQFPVFEALKRRFVAAEATPLQMGVGAAVSAGSAGCVAAVVTTPVDVVKTRVMLSALAGGGGGGGGRKRVGEVVAEILRTEGWRGFMRGGALRGGWTAVGSGLYLGSYEAAKVWLRQGREEKERQAVAI